MFFFIVFMKRIVSTCHLLKSFYNKKLLSLSYQAPEACFRPYGDFLSLKHMGVLNLQTQEVV